MKKHYLLILMFGLTETMLISCADKQKGHNDILVSNVAFANGFAVNMWVSAEMEDFFDMFYTVDSLDEKFSESKKIRKIIRGTGRPELISFLVNRENVLKFRIDLGRNQDQGGITIHSIEIRSKSKALMIKGNLLKYFFNGNRYMRILDNGEIQFSSNRSKVPFMTSSALLNKKMQIEFQD